MKTNLRVIHNALSTTWNYISADAPENMGGEEVADLVLDANYLESYGGCPKDELKAFRALSYDDQMKIALKLFPANSYF